MSVNISGNTLSLSGFTVNKENVTPTVATDNMLIWYDIGNYASYPPAGSNYYDCGYGCQYYASDPGCLNCAARVLDMSGNGNDASAATSGIQRADNDGNGYIYFTNNPSKVLYVSGITGNYTSNMTFDVWFQVTNPYTKSQQAVLGNTNNGSGYNANNLFIYTGATNTGYATWVVGFNGSSSYAQLSTGTIILAGAWCNLILTTAYSTDTVLSLYINGKLKSTVTKAAQAPTWGSGTFVLGNGGIGLGTSGNEFYGGIAVFRVYNKTLTPDEAAQNYNATRARFYSTINP